MLSPIYIKEEQTYVTSKENDSHVARTLAQLRCSVTVPAQVGNGGRTVVPGESFAAEFGDAWGVPAVVCQFGGFQTPLKRSPVETGTGHMTAVEINAMKFATINSLRSMVLRRNAAQPICVKTDVFHPVLTQNAEAGRCARQGHRRRDLRHHNGHGMTARREVHQERDRESLRSGREE